MIGTNRFRFASAQGVPNRRTEHRSDDQGYCRAPPHPLATLLTGAGIATPQLAFVNVRGIR
jgi:hypothetical protein